MRDGCKTGSQSKGCPNGEAPYRLKHGEIGDTAKKLSEYLRKKNLNIVYKP